MTNHTDSTLLETSLDSIEDIFFVFKPGGSFVDWNNTFSEMTGYSDDELADLHPTNLVVDTDGEAMNEALDTVTEELTAVTFATVLETKAGDHLHYEFRWAPLDNGERSDSAVVSIGREIDNRESTERRETQRQQRYRILAENFPNGGVFLFDADMRLEIAQGKGFESAGIDPTDFEGKRVEEVFDDESPSRFAEMCQAALDGRSQTSELAFNDRTFRVYTVPVGEATSSAQSGVAMTQDITEQKKARASIQATRSVYQRRQSRSS